MLQIENAYMWDKSAEKVKSKLTGINIGGANGAMTVDGTSQPMEIYIENHPLPINETKLFEMKKNNDTKNYSSMSVEENGEQWSYHTTNVKNESVRMVIDLLNKTYCQTFTVYMRQDKQPTTEKYLYRWHVPNNSTCRWKNQTRQDSGEPLLLSSTDSKDYVCDQPGNVIFISDSENLDGKFILGNKEHLKLRLSWWFIKAHCKPYSRFHLPFHFLFVNSEIIMQWT